MKKAFFLGSLLVIGIFFCIGCESAMNGQQIAQLITAQKRKVKISGTIDGIEWELKAGINDKRRRRFKGKHLGVKTLIASKKSL